MTQALESLQNFNFNGLLLSKVTLFELKNYRGIIFHETEEGYKIWSGIDLLFQNWHKFDKFWPEHSKVLRMFILIGTFWAKFMLFELKKVQRSYLHDIEEWCKIWKEIWLVAWKMMKNFANFHQSTQKCQNWNFDKILLSKVENAWVLNLQWC